MIGRDQQVDAMDPHQETRPVQMTKLSLAISILLAAITACAPSNPPATQRPFDGYAEANGVRLHYVSQGTGPLIMFVHGFPEFWYAWRKQLTEFGRDHRAVALDMRGFNLSSKPEGAESYRVAKAVEDLRELADHFGARKFVLVGHDWGGGIAWAFALAHPDRLEKLVIINAPHPAVFMRELANNPAQQRASQYMTTFRSPQAEQILSANNYARLTGMFSELYRAGHLTSADSVEYLKAWSQPGALTGGLNYYRALRLGPPLAGAPVQNTTVTVPTLVIWGERDPYLLTGNLDGLEAFVPMLTVKRLPDATHWVVHEQPAQVNSLIRDFIR